MRKLSIWIIVIFIIVGSNPHQADGFNAQKGFDCGYHPITAELLEQTRMPAWFDWVKALSGAREVSIGGKKAYINTRYSEAMFIGQPNARAYDYVIEQLETWYPASQIEEDRYEPFGVSRKQTWKNIIVTMPGKTNPDEVVMLTAHLDSIAMQPGKNFYKAPGADDNATGSAALLEAARLFRGRSFDRTIKFIWFTGEEQGLWGSQNYVLDHPYDNIIGVINLDMIGYDSNNDRCVELHVGTRLKSDEIGQCILDTIDAYSLGLKTEYLTDEATDRSDHGSFWNVKVGAVTMSENFFDNTGINNACNNADRNPNYHGALGDDTIHNISQETGFAVTQAALAAVSAMARPSGKIFYRYFPLVRY